MSNFTQDESPAWCRSFVMNLTSCCSRFLGNAKSSMFSVVTLAMLLLFSSNLVQAQKPTLEQQRTVFFDVCFDEIPEGFTVEQVTIMVQAAFECESLNVTKDVQSIGDDCNWESFHTFTITGFDECEGINEIIKYYYVGGDITPPALIEGEENPTGGSDLNLCFDEIPEGPTEADIAAIYEDDCGNVNVTKTGEPVGDDCEWSVSYSYLIEDDCGNSIDLKIDYNGGDTEAPGLVKNAEIPEGETGLNLCFEEKSQGPTEEEIAALFSDNCGNVTVVKQSSSKGTDCKWLAVYTYTIQDDCGNFADPIEITYSGGDFENPVIEEGPEDMTIECIDDLGKAPSLAWTDNCSDGGTVPAETDFSQLGLPCEGGIVTRTWNVSDDCGNPAEEIVQVITVTAAPQAQFEDVEDETINCEDLDSYVPPTLTVSNMIESGSCMIEAEVEGMPESFDAPCGSFVVNYTFTDECGRESTTSFTVTVIDETAPVIEGVEDDFSVECPGEFEFSMPTVSDNCDDAPVLDFVDDNSNLDECGLGTVTRTWTATDSCGNTSNASQTVTITDVTAPSIEGVGEDFSVECQQTSYNFSMPEALDTCDADVELTFVDTPDLDECGLGTVTRTWTATDCAGNTSNASQTVTVFDETAPVISGVEADYSVECPDTPVFSMPTASDNCDDQPSLTFVDTPELDECGLGTVTRTWTATDCAGNTSSDSQTITIIDTTAPVIDGVGEDFSVECPEEYEFSMPTASDLCDFGGSDITSIAFDCTFDANLTRVHSFAKNGEDNGYDTFANGVTSDSGSDFFTYLLFFNADSNRWESTENGNLLWYSNSTASTPPCDLNEWIAADLNCEFNAVTCEGGGQGEGSSVSLTFEDTDTLDECGLGTVTRTWTATDCAGNTSNASQTVTITDDTAPVIDGVGEDFTVECPNEYEFSAPTVSDECDLEPTLTFEDTDTLDDCGLGTVTRTWTATDCAGNTSNASQTVTIFDETAPVISGVEEDYTVECPDAPVFSEPSVSDSCDEQPELTFVDSPDLDECGLGTITRTWTATDCAGNTSNDSQTITIIDETAPVISGVGEDFSVECPEEYEFSMPTASDLCDDANNGGMQSFVENFDGTAAPQLYVDQTTPTNNYFTSPYASLTAGDWEVLDTSTFECAALSQPNSLVWNTEVTSANATISFSLPASNVSFNVADNTLLEVTVNHDGGVSVYNVNGNGNAGNLLTLTETGITSLDLEVQDFGNNYGCLDNLAYSVGSGSGSDVSLTFEDVEDLDECGLGTITRTWTATDCAGNTSNASQTVTIFDETAPVIEGVEDGFTVECPEGYEFSMPTAVDACDPEATISFNDTDTLDECGLGTVTRTWTATDCAGNTSNASQTVTIIDITAPLIEGVGEDFTVECQQEEYEFSMPEAIDACDPNVELTFDDESDLDECGLGTVTRTWTATDCAGNTSNASQTVTVFDETAPVISGVEDDFTVECPQEGYDFSMPTVSDNCDAQPALTFDDVSDLDDCGLGTITRTWTATDCAGNTSNESQTVTIFDNTAPVIDGVEEDYTVECPDAPVFSEPTVSDNCDAQPGLSFVDTPDLDECGLGTITRTWTATDCAGNTSNDSQTITIIDETAPLISGVGEDFTVECPEDYEFSMPTAADACDSATGATGFDDNDWTASEGFDGSITITESTVTIVGGNDGSGFDDAASVTGTCPVSGVYSFDWSYSTADAAFEFDPAYYVNGVQLLLTDGTNNTEQSGTLTLNCVAGDVIGWGIYSQDSQFGAATLVVSNYAAADTSADLTFEDVEDLDECGLGTITRTWTATDCAGNTSNASQTVTIEDNTAPVFNEELPGDVTYECDAVEEPAVLTATDACDPEVEVMFNAEITPGNCIGNYTITRTWSVSDCAGNSAEHVQIVTVQDTTAPTLNEGEELPEGESNLDLCFDDRPEGPTAEDIALLFSDNCGEVVVTKTEKPIGDDCDWAVMYSYTVADDCGNELEPFKVFYNGGDQSAPTLNEGAELPMGETGLQCKDEAPDAPKAGDLAALYSDNCGNVNIDGPEMSMTGDDCNWTVSYTFTVSDDCGNFADPIVITHSGADTIAPELIGTIPVGENELDLCLSEALAGDLGEPSAEDIAALYTDNCGDVTATKITKQYGDDCQWIVVFEYIVEDECGNLADVVKVNYQGNDNDAPVFDAECDGTFNINSCDEDPQISLNIGDVIDVFTGWTVAGEEIPSLNGCVGDNCTADEDLVLTVADKTSSTDGCNTTLTITFTATDACGNVSGDFTCTYIVGDMEAPVQTGCENETFDLFTSEGADCPADAGFSLMVGDSINGDDTSWTVAGIAISEMGNGNMSLTPCFSDNCSSDEELVYTVTGMTNTSDDCPNVLTITFAVSDACGNTAAEPFTCTFNVFDDEAPVFDDAPAEVDSADLVDLTATDNCDDDVEVTFEDSDPIEGSEQETTECVANDANNHSLWIANKNGIGATSREFNAMMPGAFIEYPDGTAKLTGTVQNEDNANQKFEYEVWFKDRMDWAEWSSIAADSPSGFREAKTVGSTGDAFLDWSYYIMDDSKVNRVIGLGDYAGVVFSVTHNPASYRYGMQVGDKASLQSSGRGMSVWMFLNGMVDGNSFSSNADFNVSLEGCETEVCGNQFIRTYTATDDCGNTETFEQLVTETCEEENNIVECGDSVMGDTSDGGTEDVAGPNGGIGNFYTFIGTGSNIAVFSTCENTSYDSRIDIFVDGNLIAGNDDSCGLQSEVAFYAQAGVEYNVFVRGFLELTGAYQLSVMCIDAPLVECGDVVTGNTSDQGPEDVSVDGGIGNFYTFVGTGQDVATFSTCDNTDYDTRITVVEAANNAFVADNDDSCGLQSVVNFFAEADVEYLIFVRGFSDSVGNYELTVTCDDFNQAANNSNEDKVAASPLNFKAYPVPFDSEVTISYDFNYDTDVRIELFDIKGLLVKDVSANRHSGGATSRTKIDLSGMPNQMFYVKLTTNQGSVTKKIISKSFRK